MKLSVVIICWNSLGNLRLLLESMEGALAGVDSEVIVVDNGSDDPTADYLRVHYPHVLYRRLDRNYGVAYARNRGIEMAGGDYVWLLDDDTEINRRALGAMMTHMDANPQCGICACALCDGDGNVQESCKPYPGLMVKVRNVLGLGAANPYAAQMSGTEPFEPEYVIGACQLVRRSVFDRVGLLDQRIFYGPEDADFCLRARRAGWHTAYLPAVSIIHKWKRITSRRPLSRIGRAHMRGLLHFYRKHRRLL